MFEKDKNSSKGTKIKYIIKIPVVSEVVYGRRSFKIRKIKLSKN